MIKQRSQGFSHRMIFLNELSKIWKLLPVRYHKEAFLVLVLTLIGTALEMIGLGLVIPALSLMADVNNASQNPALIPLIQVLGNPSQVRLVSYGMFTLFLAYLIKALYLAFLGWIQAKYVFGLKAYLSEKLFENYLRSPYEFHLQQNSGHLIRNLTVEVQQLVSNVLNPTVLLMSEFTVVLSISCLLFYFEPVGAVFLFVITGIAIYLFQRITKMYLLRWGSERQLHEGFRIQKAQEGLGGIKDVKLLGREEDFIKNYSTHNLRASLVEKKQNALSNMPRLWLETVGVMGLTLFVVIAVHETNAPIEVIPTIGLFAAAAFRILPSANRILNSIQSLRYADVVISLMLKELSAGDTNISSEMSSESRKIKFNSTIKLSNVTYAYPGASTNSLSSINLTINKGESIGLVGVSGAGKSTLVDLMLGLLKPTSGKIFVDDVDINSGMRDWQNLIGYVQQNIFLTDDTLRKNIAFGLKEQDISNALIKEAIKAAQLENFISTLTNGVDTLVGERGLRLSGGQRQRIGIARALYHNPPVLVFDEATSALDNETEVGVIDAIKAFKGIRTIIIVAHRLSTIEHCDRVYRLEGGKLA